MISYKGNLVQIINEIEARVFNDFNPQGVNGRISFPTIYFLLSYETMIRHLTLTAFASAAIKRIISISI